MNLWSADEIEGNTKHTNNLVHPSVELFALVEKTGGREWINAWDMIGNDSDIWKRDVKDADAQCNSARGEGCTFKMESSASVLYERFERRILRSQS